jgi:hypothetical protein
MRLSSSKPFDGRGVSTAGSTRTAPSAVTSNALEAVSNAIQVTWNVFRAAPNAIQVIGNVFRAAPNAIQVTWNVFRAAPNAIQVISGAVCPHRRTCLAGGYDTSAAVVLLSRGANARA